MRQRSFEEFQMNEEDNAALRATYSDLKIIKTRDSFQIIFEMPLAEFNHAMAVLGGAPRPDGEVWVAIARLNPNLARAEATPQIQAHPVAGLPPPRAPKAALTLENAKPKTKRSWFDMSAVQRASMRCDDHRFWGWLCAIGRTKEASESATLEYVRRISGGSRSNLGRNGFEKETEAWDKVDRAYAGYLERQMIDSMR
jgi:hypothetical protein